MTATDCRGLRHAEPRRGRFRVLVVEYGSGPVAARSGVVILPRNRMPLMPLIEPPKP